MREEKRGRKSSLGDRTESREAHLEIMFVRISGDILYNIDQVGKTKRVRSVSTFAERRKVEERKKKERGTNGDVEVPEVDEISSHVGELREVVGGGEFLGHRVGIFFVRETEERGEEKVSQCARRRVGEGGDEPSSRRTKWRGGSS